MTQMTDCSHRIPIHIITGFLGSGKTTFIKKILEHDNSNQTLVLINELGEIGLDNLLVKPIADNTYLLPTGCMCCTVLTDVKDSLLEMMTALKSGKITFDKIIIETTGLANPASILTTLQNDTHLNGLFFVHGMTCVIDGELALLQATNHPEWLAQMVASQQLVLSKQHRIHHEQRQKVIDYVHTLNPEAVWVNAEDFVDMAVLFSKDFSMKSQLKRFFLPNEQRKHSETQTGVLIFEQAVDWILFGLWLNLLLNQYGEQILRIKGMLYLKDVEKPILLHGVQHCLYPPEHLESPLWEDEGKKISRLIFITRGISIAQIQKSAQTILNIK